MKKFFAVIAGLALSFALAGAAQPAFAASSPYKGACAQGGADSSICKASGSDPLTGSNGTLTKVVTALAIVAGIVSVIFIIVGGIKYIFSGGDSAAVTSAKNTVIYAVIGLVVTILARQIITFALGKI